MSSHGVELIEAQQMQADISSANNGTAITTLAICPDNSRLLAGSTDGSIRVWDINESLLRDVLQAHNPPRGSRISLDSGQLFGVS